MDESGDIGGAAIGDQYRTGDSDGFETEGSTGDDVDGQREALQNTRHETHIPTDHVNDHQVGEGLLDEHQIVEGKVNENQMFEEQINENQMSNNQDGGNDKLTDNQMNQMPPVDGYQLVQASGLTDTATAAPKGSTLPSFATASPAPTPYQPETQPQTTAEMPPPIQRTQSSTPLDEDSKSSRFNQRFDYMIADFFSRQVKNLVGDTPGAVERGYRVFQQKFKERLGAQWAHITAQPEVDEAIAQVQLLNSYFERLEKLIARQLDAMHRVNDVDTEVSLYYKQEGLVEESGEIRENLLYLSSSYQTVCTKRISMIQAYEGYLDFLRTFRKKAIGDSLETMKKQNYARLELDSYGSKLGQLEEKKLKTFARAPTLSNSEASSLEKELEIIRLRFQAAKSTYQGISTQLIDKAGLLEMKKAIDFGTHLQRIREVHDSFNNMSIERQNSISKD